MEVEVGQTVDHKTLVVEVVEVVEVVAEVEVEEEEVVGAEVVDEEVVEGEEAEIVHELPGALKCNEISFIIIDKLADNS